VREIKRSFAWLKKIVDVCNKKTGNPFKRCIEEFENGIEACQ
jgi:hypothetical protein